MSIDTSGIHHVTAIGTDPARNRRFYTETLGLRLVKRSVNQDDTSVWHLFYGDYEGSPGTSMTFFPYTNARRGQVGAGQVSTTGFLVPKASIEYWQRRLEEHGVDVGSPTHRFDETVLEFEDPDGLQLELVGRDDVPAGKPPDGPVPKEHAIRGFSGVTLQLQSAEKTIDLLKTMGLSEGGTDGPRQRFKTEADIGSTVDVIDNVGQRGIQGAGTVHHVAFRITRENREEWRELLMDQGLRPTEVIDRKWFESIYTREFGGILFEFATEAPGYTVDEPLEELGESLVLPEWFADQREQIEANLPSLN